MRTHLDKLSDKATNSSRLHGIYSSHSHMLLVGLLVAAMPLSFADTLRKEQIKRDLYTIEEVKNYQELRFRFKDRFENSWQIAGYRWSVNANRLAVLVHGYADNCGYLKPLQTWFLHRQWDVVCLELPGHGQSSGRRGDIPNMLVYEDMYRHVFPKLNESHYQQLIFYGHSTGNVGMIEYLLNRRKHPFETIIMATPLVRSNHWHLSKIGNLLLGWSLKTVPRRNIAEKNIDYQTLRKLDPNPIERVPLHWFDQLLKWNQALESDSRLSQETVAVIFASDDSVIDTRYNKNFFEQHFLNANYYFIPDADHILHYNDGEALALFYQVLERVMSKPK